MGERIFLARDRYDIPDHHIRASHVLTGLSAIGLAPLTYGLIALDPFAVLAGLVAIILPKVWFCDRMVWIHAELTGTTPGKPLSTPLLPPERT